MKNQTIILSVAAIAIGAAGFFMGKSSSSGLDVSDTMNRSSSVSISRGSSLSHAESKRRDAARGQAFSSSSEGFEQGFRMSRIEELISFYKTLNTSELAEQADKLEKFRNETERSFMYYLLFAQWVKIDPLGAIAKAESASIETQYTKVRIFDAWASIDPLSAAEYYAENEKDMLRDESTPTMIPKKLAEKDPEAAFNWAVGLGVKHGSWAVESVFEELGKNDPDKATQLALRLENKELRNDAYDAIINNLDLSGDYSEVEAWIATLPVEKQNRARAVTKRDLAREKPDEAVQQLDQLTDPKQRVRQIDRIAIGYAHSGDAAKGVEFLVGVGSQKSLEKSIDKPMKLWISQEPEQARGYVLAMPSGQTRDTILKSYLISNSGHDDYVRQLDLAVTIENKTERGDAYNELMKRFVEVDESSARAYLAENKELSEEQQEEIISHAKR